MGDVAGPYHGDRAKCDAHNHEARTETVFVSPAEQALDRLRETSPFLGVDEAPSSRLRVVVPALVLALLVTLGWTYAMTPGGRTYFLRIARLLVNGKVASKRMIFLPVKQPLADARSASTVSSSKRPSHTVENLPIPHASAQSSSGIEHSGEISKSLQQAALSGDADAQFKLGTAYAVGRDIPADPVIGYTWLTIAFANGDQQAESAIRQLTLQLSQSQIAQIRWNVGEMYANGVGVQPDKVTAYMWHLLAELAGEKRSTVAKSHLAATMTSDQRTEASARASRWLRRHRN
jgi:Sel1 repeat